MQGTERALDHVESTHLGAFGVACGGEVFGMTESARLRQQKVTSERENRFRAVQMVERPQRLSREQAGPSHDVLVSMRLVDVPGGARESLPEGPSQHGERWRGVGFSENGEALASAIFERECSFAPRIEKRIPARRLLVIPDSRGAVGIVATVPSRRCCEGGDRLKQIVEQKEKAAVRLLDRTAAS